MEEAEAVAVADGGDGAEEGVGFGRLVGCWWEGGGERVAPEVEGVEFSGEEEGGGYYGEAEEVWAGEPVG